MKTPVRLCTWHGHKIEDADGETVCTAFSDGDAAEIIAALNAAARPALHRPTVRALMDLMSIEGCNFYHNRPNDYGCITAKLFTGEGSAVAFMGEELQGNFQDGRRGTGYFKLNEAGIDRIMELLTQSATTTKEPQ